jgi:tripartite-type tricarboxylate transporter receptor subunit TctC
MKKTGIAVVAVMLGATAQAQPFPSKPLRLVVPFPPGGTVDVTARAIAPALAEALGQNVIVDNRGGAQGLIGADLVAKSKPDGYVLLMGSNSTLSVAPSLQAKSPYDPVRDFTPISLVGMTPFVLVVHPSVPARTLKEFIAIAKSKPERLTMGSGGVGHLVGELFQSLTGTRFTHVPFQGTGPAGIALMGGHVDLMFDQLVTSLGPIQSGKTRALAVSSRSRSTVVPSIPTMGEAGVRGFEVTSITGVLAPPGTPADVVDRINAAVHKVLAMPATKERFAAMSLETVPSTPAQFAAYIKEDYARWTGVVRAANIPLN